MKKTFLLGLLAASLMLSATSCSNPDFTRDEEMAVRPLPPIPAAPDTAGGRVAPENPATREITAPNATEDIKKMQPVM
ncbi:hypothetical protein [Hymenobacter sp.]|jgi:hypothetical protein|uniref:hypothetical protein n=1 Tax=Hymenobacter sp. TaxID=1898978 RepID=UPI002ED8978C